MTNPDANIPEARSAAHPTFEQVERLVARRSFCTLGTAAPNGRPHAVGVLYAPVDGALFVSTLRSSRKARNVADNPAVFVSIPVRRVPFGPPSSVQYASTAELLAPDDPVVRGLAADGRLKSITAHGELDLPGGCFVRIAAPSVVHTYGIGLSLISLMRNPLDAAGRVSRPSPAQAVTGEPGRAVIGQPISRS
jgi:hypothetical protein